MRFVSRGFRGRRSDADVDPNRVPPGQYVPGDFPVLSAGPTPHTPLEEWMFSIVAGDERKTWTWEEFHELPIEPGEKAAKAASVKGLPKRRHETETLSTA